MPRPLNATSLAAPSRRRLTLGLAAGAGLAGAPWVAHAAWPADAPIRMLVAYAPGGGTDITARLIAPFIEKYLGNGAKVVVMNRPGAGGGIGFAELAAAKPDGTTIGFINTPNLLSIPIERKVNFHWQNYDLIGNVIDDPGVFAVHNDSPIRSLADLATFARANPGKVTVGTTGIGSDDHLAMMLFERQAGVKMTHVPFKGTAETRTALQSQTVMLAAANVGEVLGFIKGGSPFRTLGQMSQERTNLAPDMPTFREQGHGIVSASLRGIAAPKGLPSEIREALIAAIGKAAADPEFQAKSSAAFTPLRYLAPAAYEAELRDTENMLRQLWKEMPWG
jgi:tripartite-type tricarboxylate transporter receptor subunit TctC